jgi:hypothetical protein
LIVARPLSPGYLYIFQVDSTGKKEWVFPQNQSSTNSVGSNPVMANRIIQVPTESSQALYLDQTLGVEHVYAVFSAARWPELERALFEEPVAPRQAHSSLSARSVQEPLGLRLRGVGGTRTNVSSVAVAQKFERINQGKPLQLAIASEAFEASSSFLAIERWFRHAHNP